MIIALTIIIILLILALYWVTQEANKWETKYFKKPEAFFSTDFDITKQIDCIDSFYSIVDNRVCKFKTTELTLGLSDNGEDYPFWSLKYVEGECIEGPGDKIGESITFRSDNIYLTKKSLLENL